MGADLPLFGKLVGDVETDICHKQIHGTKHISIKCNRIVNRVHLRCAGIRLAQYTDTWTCHLHKESRLTTHTDIISPHFSRPWSKSPTHSRYTPPTQPQPKHRHTSNTPRVPTGLVKPQPNLIIHSPPPPSTYVAPSQTQTHFTHSTYSSHPMHYTHPLHVSCARQHNLNHVYHPHVMHSPQPCLLHPPYQHCRHPCTLDLSQHTHMQHK